jgi:nucleoside 2-deoxyribosyltransferase
MLTVYIAIPISGRSYDEVTAEIFRIKDFLECLGYKVFHPLSAKGYLRTEVNFKKDGYGNPPSTNHAIFERDRWMIEQSDIVLMNLTDATAVSIGCMMELAWASMLGKQTIVAMDEENIHRHAFVLEAADIVFPTMGEAVHYLGVFSTGKMGED